MATGTGGSGFSIGGYTPSSFGSDLIAAGVGSTPHVATGAVGALSPEQEAALQALLQQLGGNLPQYQGQTNAAGNNVQGQSLAAMEAAAMNAVGPSSDAAASSGALRDVMNQNPADLQAYYKSNIVDPAMQVFQQQIMPDISRRFKGQAGFGSDRMLADATAAGNATTGIAQAMGAASQQSLQDQQRNKIAAALGLPGVNTAQTQNLLALQSGGNIAQGIQQSALDRLYGRFQDTQARRQKQIEDLLAALGIKTTNPYAIGLGGQTGAASSSTTAFLGGLGGSLGHSGGGGSSMGSTGGGH